MLRLFFLALIIQACSGQSQIISNGHTLAPTFASTLGGSSPLITLQVEATGISTDSASNSSDAGLTPTPTLSNDFWMDLPVVPAGLSKRAQEIYQRGLLMGNDPHAFSKVGDCNSTNPYFLADFDLGPNAYDLGDYLNLQSTVDYFQGSFSRASLAAKQGLSTAGVLSSLRADWKVCQSNETPLDCEFRLHHPSVAIISLGTNEAYDVKADPSTFEPRLRRIIEHSIDQGVLPILSTKADNDEGDQYINYVTARLAAEYELPLWNYWKAVQPLSQHGLRDLDHLTSASTKSFADFSKPEYLDYGMQMRNLTGLQVLDMVRREISRSQGDASETPEAHGDSSAGINNPGGAMVSSIDGMTSMYIPAGEFAMGSTSGDLDETPVHAVQLDAFWLDSTEVTNSMFTNFLNSEGNQSEGGVDWLNPINPYVWVSKRNGSWQAAPEKENLPIVGVSWYGADAYCSWAGRELPTEAQWEYATKGLESLRFPWGNDDLDCDRARYSGCGTTPVQVASLPLGANTYGIFDLAGNVSEWLNDRYSADYYKESPLIDPPGPANGYYRVVRGGYWGSTYIGLQTTHRDWAGADERDESIGFRCALNP